MRLHAQLIDSQIVQLSWDNIKNQYDEKGQKIDYESPSHRKEDGWYEIEREPKTGEYLEYDEENDCIVIKKREKSAGELEAERQAAVKRQLVADLPDIILQNKDNPEALAQALCDRAKEIEVTNDLRRT